MSLTPSDMSSSRAPGEVEGVDGQAVPAGAGSGLKAHEPVGLGGGRTTNSGAALYVTNWSLWGDVRLILRTLPVVLRRSGAN